VLRQPDGARVLRLNEGVAVHSVWRADTVLNELATHLPDSHKGLMQISEAWGTPQQGAVLNEIYPKLPKISVDYAIMEPASQGKGAAQVTVVEMPIKWLDVGSWPALAETLQTDDHANRQHDHRDAQAEAEHHQHETDDDDEGVFAEADKTAQCGDV